MQEAIVTLFVLFAILVVWKTLSPNSFRTLTGRILSLFLKAVGQHKLAARAQEKKTSSPCTSCYSGCRNENSRQKSESFVNIDQIKHKSEK